jgi:hypothetical protein
VLGFLNLFFKHDEQEQRLFNVPKLIFFNHLPSHPQTHAAPGASAEHENACVLKH